MQRTTYARTVPTLIASALIALLAACSPATPVLYVLTVTTAGTGAGTVTSSPTGIDTAVADGDEADFTSGTVVTLTATAGAFSAFGGWTGACAGTVGATCDVTMDAAKSVGATFDLLLGTLFLSQDGNANGLYSIDLATGAATIVGAGVTNVTSATVGLAGRGASDPLIGSLPFGVADVALDGSSTTSFSGNTAEGLTYVASTNLIYTILNGSFGTMSPTTGLVVDDLTDPGFDLEGLAADEASGQIYAIGDGDTNLWVYSIAFDAWAVVFDTGVNWDQAGLAYSDAEGVLYAFSQDGFDGLIYRIDPVAETVTEVGDTGLAGSLGGGLAWVPAN
ncbi:MAG: hypothetical protein P1P87_03390 [Trueperaceae bacterium]|nr:hypothetical protein [Trueperaceae bacterium]